MDAPPATEDVRPYLHVTALLEPLGIHVPHVYEADVARGFVLLEDLGSTHYLAQLGAGGDAAAALRRCAAGARGDPAARRGGGRAAPAL